MFQTWRLLTFLHWPYQPRLVQQTLPAGLTLDTFGGAAWIGLVPFVLADLRPPVIPGLPWISRFPETNVRTYVIDREGKRGVWFFTLEAARLGAVLGARMFYRLPYRWARMSVHDDGNVVRYQSDRRWPFGHGQTRISVKPGKQIEPGQFENFLTARYRLYTKLGGRVAYGDIEHQPWPLQSAELVELQESLIEQFSLPVPEGQPVVHFSRALKVRIDRLRLAPKAI